MNCLHMLVAVLDILFLGLNGGVRFGRIISVAIHYDFGI